MERPTEAPLTRDELRQFQQMLNRLLTNAYWTDGVSWMRVNHDVRAVRELAIQLTLNADVSIDPCTGEVPHTGPWEKIPGSDQASRCACGFVSGK